MEIFICNTDIKLHFDDNWQRVNPMPDDPKDLSIIGLNHENCYSLIFIKPISEKEIIPIGNKELTIDSIRNFLTEKHGLIEVNTETNKYPYIYSIVKTLKEPSGVQYILMFHVKINENYYQIQGFFDEMGTTGVRDNIVYESFRRGGLVKLDEKTGKLIGWRYDPYDPNYNKGLLMNLSEQEAVDEHFPYHPLSEARRLVKKLIETFNDLYDKLNKL